MLLVAGLLSAGGVAETVPVEPQQIQEPVAEESAAPEETPEETPAPEESAASEETPAPEETPTPEESASPEESPSAEETPAAEVTHLPEIEGYLLDAQGVQLQGGALKELLQAEGALRVCVCTQNRIHLENFPLHRLNEIEFLPDEALNGRYRVVLSASDDPADEYTPEIIAEFAEDAVGELFIWLMEQPDQPTPTPAPEQGLQVSPEDYYAGRWSCVPPTFHLSGIDENDTGSDYAVIILDERIALLSGSDYMPQDEGAYSVRFAIMDGMGDLTSRSERYDLMLDFTPPELIVEVSQELDRTMTLHLSDALSGAASLSLDGGASWIALDGMESYPYTATEKQVFVPGSIQLMDGAGNLAENAEEIVLDKLPRMSGGGGGDSTPKKQHASGDGDTALYNAYPLELPEESVQTLTLGGDAVELSMELVSETTPVTPGSFRAEMLRWTRNDGTEEGEPDTLLLTAEPLNEDEADCARVWRINGAVLRKLYNSDVRYLLLDVDGAMLSLPTQGFVAGTRYAELKMQGASTAEFTYEIRMRSAEDAQALPFNRAPGCAAEIWVEVAGERFELIDRLSTPEMYPCDVYCAPDDLPDYPYGAYPAFADDTETEV